MSAFNQEGKEAYHAGLEVATTPNKHSPSPPLAMATSPNHHQQMPGQQQQQYPMMQESGVGTFPGGSPPPMSAYPYDHPPSHPAYSTMGDQRAQNGGAFAGAEGPAKREPTIMGLRPATFFLSLALLVAVVVAAVGGGVGGSVAVQNARRDGIAEGLAQAMANGSASASATVTLTTTVSAGSTSQPSSSSSNNNAVVDPPTKGKLKLDCPGLDGSKQIINIKERSYTFDVICGADYNGKAIDIAAITTYSLHDCMQACAMYNVKYGSESPCIAAAFNTDLTGSVAANFGTCFIKNATGTQVKKDVSNNVGVRLSATT